ncbi:MAG TPA: hypothetical protein VK742_05045 [Candidatus Sulfotelmatobacter sp.]|jgi:hypothetical protein|nr:hypothetical protein [Candidatus Sulfotelmatobacter sp.]
MKRQIFVLLAAVFVAGGASAQYFQAEQQAKRASQQNDAEQQRIANASGNGSAGQSSQPVPGTPPADPILQATLNNIASLQADLAAFVGTDKPDPAQKNSLLGDMSQAAQGKKATTDSAKELAKDLQTALTGKKSLAAAQQKQLAAFIHASFNGSHLTDAQSDKITGTAQKILTDAGVSTDAAVDIVTDMKKVIADTK